LANAILEGKCSKINNDEFKGLINDVEDGLRFAVNKTSHVAKDINGEPINLDDFIGQRLTEVTKVFVRSKNQELAAELGENMKSAGVVPADGSKINTPRKEGPIQGRY